MKYVNRWLQQPQNVWLRRAIFQIHLWSGVAIGAYMVVICLSGSALVFRNEIIDYFTRGPIIVQTSGTRMTEDELAAVAQREYPGYTVTNIFQGKQPNQAVAVWLEGNDGARIEQLFDPYSGNDLGKAEPATIRFMFWLGSLHDELLFSDTGRTVNGWLGLIMVVICLTGAVIWWPGVSSWRRSTAIEWKANWKRLNWTLHSAIGFWTFLIVFGFAFTGFYLVFQEPFIAIVDYLEPLAPRVPGVRRVTRTGDTVLRWMSRLHFGRFNGNPHAWIYQTIWVVLGLIPVVLAVTGAIMWWNRVLAPALRTSRRNVATSGVLVERNPEITS